MQAWQWLDFWPSLAQSIPTLCSYHYGVHVHYSYDMVPAAVAADRRIVFLLEANDCLNFTLSINRCVSSILPSPTRCIAREAVKKQTSRAGSAG